MLTREQRDCITFALAEGYGIDAALTKALLDAHDTLNTRVEMLESEAGYHEANDVIAQLRAELALRRESERLFVEQVTPELRAENERLTSERDFARQQVVYLEQAPVNERLLQQITALTAQLAASHEALKGMTALKVEALAAWNIACDELAAMTQERDEHSKYLDEIKTKLDCHRAFIPETVEQLKEQLAASEKMTRELEARLGPSCTGFDKYGEHR